MPVSTNGLTNPSFETNTTAWAAANSATISRVTTEKRIGAASLQVIATAINSGARVAAANAPAFAAGSRAEVLAWVKATAGTGLTVRAEEFTLPSTAGQTASTSVIATGDWQPVSAVITATGAAGNVVRPSITTTSAGATFYVDTVKVGTDALPYYDGATPADSTYQYAWTGTAHASTSMATPWVDVTLVPSGDPNPVQIVMVGIPNGVTFEVVGTTADSTWPVPGGTGVSDGGQVVLIDNRGALNTPTVYEATWGGVTYTSPPITVPYAGRYVLQSLDGQTIVPFVWLDNGLPRDYAIRSVSFDVPGRDRPPGRYATSGDGGGALELRTDRENSPAMLALIKAGRPVVVRTDGTIRDFPAVELVKIDQISSKSRSVLSAPGVYTADRIWDARFILVDDPEPSARLSAWTGDDFDAAMATRTGADFDALFATLTWDQFDTYPWGQLA